ncbi:hypothetical protein [Natronomonas marina]|jgi:hypothetical protein|uniref:hypothetical protein n=1 Tax=Natronomonas marina TaxID=2961939 RepID=UPI0020C9D4C7|nr:hypothetical protein [Natronomonas marina]
MAEGVLARGRWTKGDALVGVVILATGAAMVFEGGILGAGVAAAVAVLWIAAGTPYAFVLGQVGLVVGLDGGPTTTPIAQAALVLLLITDVTVDRTYAAGAAALAVAALTTAVLLYADRALTGTETTGFLMLATTAGAVYGIHRYERVALGLAGDPE